MKYSKIFSVVLVIFTASASSLYIDFDEELPLYLTDDFLISKIGKRSVTNNDDVRTTSQPSTTPKPVVTLNSNNPTSAEKKSDKKPLDEKYGTEESGLVFLPSFGRRTRRAVNAKEQKDLLNSESNIIFLPSFRRRGFRRSRRDIDSENHKLFILKRRSADENAPSQEHQYTKKDETKSNFDGDLENAEAGLVFLPSFGRKTRSIFRRDTSNTDNEQTSNSPDTATEKNEELQNQDSQEREESGLVFIPSFGRKTRSINKRDIPENDKKKEEPKTENSKSTESKRDVSNDKKANDAGKQSQKSKNEESEEEQESGLVFIPSFGRKTRSINKRDISENDKTKEEPTTENSKSTESKRDVSNDKKASDAGKQSQKSKNEESEEEQESGLVFIPSFGRKTRSINKRDIPENDKKKEEPTTENSKSTESKRNVSNDKKANDEGKQSQKSKNEESEEEQESGLVFIPSFGRKTRSINKRDIPENDKKKEEPTTENSKSTESKRDVSNDRKASDAGKQSQKSKNEESEEEQESGLVFIPSFGRKTRSINKRDISENNKNKEEPTTENSKSTESKRDVSNDKKANDEDKQSQKSKNEESEEEEESGLVFIPSFGRRSRRSISSEKSQSIFRRSLDDRSQFDQETSDKKEKNKELNTDSDMEESENGMVFLTSFGKKH